MYSPISSNRKPTTTVVATSSSSSGSALEKFLVGGTVAWTYEFVLGHFLEFVKIAKQTNHTKSYGELAKEMVAKKGLVGVWDGFFPWGSLQAVAKGAVFSSAHIAARSRLQPLVRDGKLPSQVAEVVAGGIGGGFQGLVLSPLLLLKTRVMTDPIFRGNMSMWQTCVGSTNVGMSLIRKEGPAALMKGSVMFSVKRVADWSTRYMFAEMIEYGLQSRHADGAPATQTEKVISSFLGGALSTVATIPMDVMVAQIQQASKAGQKVSALDAFKAQMKEGGMGAVVAFSMRGLVARVGHVSLTTVVMKTGTEYAYGVYNSLGSSSSKH